MEVNEKIVAASDEPEIKYRGGRAMPFIIVKISGNETFEKLGAIGTLSNLLVYLTTVFNLKGITATVLLNVFNGTTNFATLLGAFLCDTYFGRYKTLGFASITSFLELLLIDLTAIIKKLHPPRCGSKAGRKCVGPTTWQMAFLLSGFALMVAGAAGIRPCNLAFGADQFNSNTVWQKRNQQLLQLMVSLTLVAYVQSDLSWAIGLGIPTAFMLVSCVVYFTGTKIYVKVKPEGSPFTNVAQVKPRQPWLSLFNHVPSKSINSKLPYTEQFRYLDKAAIMTCEDQIKPDGSPANPWEVCSIQQVEQVKCVMRVIPIWATGIVYHIAVAQQQQYVVFQALQSNRHLGNSKFQIPAATYTIFSMLSLTIFLPIYDRALVPTPHRLTGKEGGITILQRMGAGIFLSVLASLVSASLKRGGGMSRSPN
ncbi:hypothetical protein RJ639_032566 [Escallonia herrerae]|uniref:Uncharacterized protein n=1 Tax=Escallonia herrerae TaxID=1293975 RepID=A0AA88WY88_9ASTE|nr:hypothetical protein RJ639_032566 [Escallonia herrerae]